VLTEPVAVMRGDHFILRDETAQRTLGGGIVLLPAAEKRKRSDPSLLHMLEALEQGEDSALFAAVIDSSGAFAVTLPWLAERLNDTDEQIRRRVLATSGLHVFELDAELHCATLRVREAAVARLVQAVAEWHATHPLSPGLDVEEARSAMTPVPVPRVFRVLLDELERAGRLVREGSAIRLPSHRVVVTGADQVAVDRVMSALSLAPFSPPDVKQLLETLGLDRSKLIALLKAMEKGRQVVAVATDLYFAADVIDRLREELVRDLSGGQTLTTADFRDRYKTSRKYAIPLLEYFDRAGVTTRIGDARKLRESARKA
jgi:selenocysteine-specific elongation factor